MARGETQRLIAEAAARDGVVLTPQSLPWLNQQGHLGLPAEPPGGGESIAAARTTLNEIFVALGGDLDELGAGRRTPLPGDFVHEPTGSLVEVDESQHFTSFRLLSLDLYPDDVRLGFDRQTYRSLCEEWKQRSDAYFRTKSARTFGLGGRQRQRAYYDALRDLAAPAMGRPPTIRIEAADRNSGDAYERHREQLLALLD